MEYTELNFKYGRHDNAAHQMTSSCKERIWSFFKKKRYFILISSGSNNQVSKKNTTKILAK